jgi:lipopolysaccharide biosynthesis glycosyltransferase
MVQKTIVFTIADEKNMPFAKMMEKSFKHFHPDVPLIIYGDKEIKESNIPTPHFFYLSTPYFARQLIKEYEQCVKIDADSIITAPLEIIDSPENFDVGVVFNWTRDAYSNQVKVWDITPQGYFNNGFVVFRSEELINHIWKLCNEAYFPNYQFREQDMLNIVAYYGNYKVKVLDINNSWYGLQSKSEWNKAIMQNGKIVIPKGKDMFPMMDKTLRVIHYAGGEQGVKGNYKIYFNEEVSSYIDSLIK